ncbi:TetR/AcrR family transcriptional regulator [Mycobacterium paraseoulense]|uniref:HTH tetR-type domain-containing protein n=1 Tax=Mycobacterium paraseoulense TaxID=590652 RepID=A0A1X0IF02_9MYCO|nr:TetR/AcrR family transcriptional regulator C-terminal domain-containing protein [Mycobacterium paraseoulense]MCV7393776.1 TetR/AcrR family transcriptional regulator C-terminal domain-containing protein [Mycobacterium paraseoulense]ORB45484.1 hypothetical protein BST39_04545 [Mycobacterium paraseoulense]BBZ70607.1 hypothetical protein MPRS_17000 [Mycobacterium paraseoulense]
MAAERIDSEVLSRRTSLTLDTLIDSAVTIALSEGLDALTMRRLAEATGKAPMTLYSYVPNKEALLDLVADALMARVVVPTGPWDQALTELSLSTWRAMSQAAGLASFIWKHVPYFFTPEGLRLADGAMGLLVDGGFEAGDASRALEALMTFITGDVQRREARARLSRRSLTRKVKGYPNLEAAAVGATASRKSATESEESFSYGLDLLLEGLRRDPRRKPRR